jgi:hypothetical protein
MKRCWLWLRSWFAWRFSLARLVIAVVFLGVVVGLNVQKIGPLWCDELSYCYGWPFPALAVPIQTDEPLEWLGYLEITKSYRWPWMHSVYGLVVDGPRFSYPLRKPAFGAIIDALVALIQLALILFFHPRRKPEREGAR